MDFRLGIYYLIFLFQTAICSKTKNEKEGGNDEANYYGIYEAIDTLVALTGHRTFYEFLGVSPEAANEDVSRAFRRTAIQYHPDKLKTQGKWDTRSEKLSNLSQFIGSLLRTEKGRKDYDWVLNEAPAWHRQSIYVMKKLVRTSRLSLWQVSTIVLGFSILLQLMAHWLKYAVQWYMIISSRSEIRAMGEKEIKRIKKRMQGIDPAYITVSNPACRTILLAESPAPSIPNPLDLWIFKLPIFLIKWPIQKIFSKTGKNITTTTTSNNNSPSLNRSKKID